MLWAGSTGLDTRREHSTLARGSWRGRVEERDQEPLRDTVPSHSYTLGQKERAADPVPGNRKVTPRKRQAEVTGLELSKG